MNYKCIHFCFINTVTPRNSLQINQLERMVYVARAKQFANTEGLIRSFPLNICGPEANPFLHFFLEIPGSKGGFEKIIGWGLPDLIHEAKYEGVHLFIDATFKCCPIGFTQCLIFMVYNFPTDMYLPVFFTLMTRKEGDLYKHALQNIIAAADWKIFGKSICCDYEKALVQAAKMQFPEGRFVKCLFHWKQVKTFFYYSAFFHL